MVPARTAERLKGKTALVTSGTSGVGFAVARRLCQEGAQVTLCGLQRDVVETAVQYLSSEGFTVSGAVLPSGVGPHVTWKRLLRRISLQYEQLDCIVACEDCAPSDPTAVLDIDDKTWEDQFDCVLKRTFFMVKAMKPLLTKSSASVVLMSSVLGYQPMPGFAMRSMTSASMLALTKALAGTWAGDGVRVNCVAAGILAGGAVSRILHLEEEEVVSELVPMGRLAIAEDCAAAAAFLCSRDAEYITGEAVVVNGGVASRL